MTGFDIAVLLVVGTGAIIGFMRGFVHEILALAAWVFAVFAIRVLHTPVTAWLEPHIGSGSGAYQFIPSTWRVWRLIKNRTKKIFGPFKVQMD